jgi:hypothetical protein
METIINNKSNKENHYDFECHQYYTEESVAPTLVLSRNPDSNYSNIRPPQYEAMLNTLTQEDKENIRKMVAKDLVNRAEMDVEKRRWYRHVADTTETLGKFLAGLTSILAFSATAFQAQSKILSFLAGIVGTVGVVLSGWSQYASKESDERLSRLNVILRSLGLSPVPADPDTNNNNNNNNNDESAPSITEGSTEKAAVTTTA